MLLARPAAETKVEIERDVQGLVENHEDRGAISRDIGGKNLLLAPQTETSLIFVASKLDGEIVSLNRNRTINLAAARLFLGKYEGLVAVNLFH